jgi:hypothetical protein
MAKFDAVGVEAAISALLIRGAKRATVYRSPRLVVSAQRVMFQGRIDGRDSRATIVVKIGAPNFAERKFIKACQKAGERFPVRKVQLKFPPKAR